MVLYCLTHVRTVKLLLTTIAAVVLVGCGKSSIHDAAWDGNIEAVKQHLAAGEDVNALDEYGKTSLYRASLGAHKEIAELLIANGADLNAKGTGGGAPLHVAAGNGHKEATELLVGAGADVNVIDVNGKTPLDWAHNKEITDLLRKHGGKTGEELKAEGE